MLPPERPASQPDDRHREILKGLLHTAQARPSDSRG
jgi:hypothetical protein